jgi:hypothetical protein
VSKSEINAKIDAARKRTAETADQEQSREMRQYHWRKFRQETEPLRKERDEKK